MPFESSCTERRVKRKYVNKEASLFNFQIRKIDFFSLVESECLHLSINLACLFVSNKRQNGWTDRAQIFCGTSRDHREGLWMIKNVF